MTRSALDVLIDVRDVLVAPGRIGQFLGVGLVGAVIDLGVSAGLVLGSPLSPVGAKFVGAECAIVLMFFINDRWTFARFGADGSLAKLRRLVKSNVVRSGGLAVQLVVVWLLTGIDVTIVLAGTDVWDLLTLPIAIGCAAVVNYVAESLFTWRLLRDE